MLVYFVYFCCVWFSFSVVSQEECLWRLWRMSPKWSTLCWVGCKTLTQSVVDNASVVRWKIWILMKLHNNWHLCDIVGGVCSKWCTVSEWKMLLLRGKFAGGCCTVMSGCYYCWRCLFVFICKPNHVNSCVCSCVCLQAMQVTLILIMTRFESGVRRLDSNCCFSDLRWCFW